jgi:hypothetical protein
MSTENVINQALTTQFLFTVYADSELDSDNLSPIAKKTLSNDAE